MYRTVVKTLMIGAVASTLITLAVPNTAKADHRRSSFGVYVGPGGFSFGANYGPSYYYPRYPRVGVYSPVVVPNCCRYERIYVPVTCDHYGVRHGGYYRTYRVCDHHGRGFAY